MTIAAVAVLVVAACGEPSGPGAQPEGTRAELTGSWELAEGTGPDGAVPLVESHPITLRVEADEDRLGGTAACNSYGGEFDLDGERMSVTELFATEMACFPEEVMAAEQAYLRALSQVEAFARDGDRLVLTGPGVELVFQRLSEPADLPLTGTRWVLDTLVDGEAVTNVPELDRLATLELREGGDFEAFTGCNVLTGSYTEQDDGLAFSPLSITDVACVELGDLQDHVLDVLDGEVAVDVSGSRLTLTGAGGLGLSYRADPDTPTSDTVPVP